MAELSISKRAIFPRGRQRDYISMAKKTLNLPYVELAKLVNISNRTLTDWKREKLSMSLRAVEIISKKTGKKMPKNVKIREPFWYVYKGAKIGGKLGAIACFKKYGSYGGNPEYRKKKWYEWWEREGRFKKHPIIGITKPIKKPRFSKELAEFMGIVMGDGGITKSQVKITLHYKDDKKYGEFVIDLIKKLFDVYVGTCYRKKYSVIHYVVSRTELVRFCIGSGLKLGNKIKQQIDIPDWIKENKQYAIACVRGLIDTDGCIFTHRYRVNSKFYSYKKLCFTSYSEPLRQSVYRILKSVGLNPRFAQRRDVRLDSVGDMQKYFQVIGSHNPKHLNKYFQ